MALVRVIKDWDFPDLLHQTPGNTGQWDDNQFTLDQVLQCDYVIVLNRVPLSTTVNCPPQHIWAIVQEPSRKWLKRGFGDFYQVYTQDTNLRRKKYIYSQPVLPWHVGKSYDVLVASAPPEKPKQLSWITSNADTLSGHKDRMVFLEKLKNSSIEFDLWGRGFQFIDDKWDGLAPYRYSLAVENYSGPHYWSEKLADCFLSWAMPIYYGCTNILDYFPAESMIQIDIKKPNEAIAIVREAVQGNLWQRNQDAIAYARELILNKYQFFPFVSDLIHDFKSKNPDYPAQEIKLQALRRPSKRRPVKRVLSKVKKMVFHER
jgi:hypothetical protein